MGLFGRLLDYIRSAPVEERVLLLGPTSSGKTSLQYRLSLGKFVSRLATIGPNQRPVLKPYSGVTYCVWDLSGHANYAAALRYYFALGPVSSIIFVVDSAGEDSVGESEGLHSLLNKAPLRVPLMVMANKQDITGAICPQKVSQVLGLHCLTGRKWHIQGTSAVSGEGLDKAMHALARLERNVYE